MGLVARMIEDPPPLTPQEEPKWRVEFKGLGRERVRVQERFFVPDRKRELARRWQI
jgi:hypothetical protein